MTSETPTTHAKTEAPGESEPPRPQVLRPHAEELFAEELEGLRREDERARPPGWALSPWATKLYILGGTLRSGLEIRPKYIGSPRLIAARSAVEALLEGADGLVRLGALPRRVWLGKGAARAR